MKLTNVIHMHKIMFPEKIYMNIINILHTSYRKSLAVEISRDTKQISGYKYPLCLNNSLVYLVR